MQNDILNTFCEMIMMLCVTAGRGGVPMNFSADNKNEMVC